MRIISNSSDILEALKNVEINVEKQARHYFVRVSTDIKSVLPFSSLDVIYATSIDINTCDDLNTHMMTAKASSEDQAKEMVGKLLDFLSDLKKRAENGDTVVGCYRDCDKCEKAC